MPNTPRRDAAFTLVELILVMAMLVIIIAVAAPSLSQFFRGRVLDSEARRLLSLTRYAQSRAVSEGTPMVLWIDAQEGAYGLEAETTYTGFDDRAVDYELDENLVLEVDDPITIAPSTMQHQSRSLPGRPARGQTPRIRFLPDGFIGEGSPDTLWLREEESDRGGDFKPHSLWISQSRNRLNYELRTNRPAQTRW